MRCSKIDRLHVALCIIVLPIILVLSGCGGSTGPQPLFTKAVAYSEVPGKAVKLVNTNNGSEMYTITNPDYVGALTFVGGGADIAVVSWTGSINIYNVSTGSHVQTINCGYSVNYQRIASSPDGKYIAVTGNSTPEDYKVKLWNQQTAAYDYSFDLGTGVETMEFSPDGRYLAAGGAGGAVKIWNISTGSSINVGNNTTQILSIAFSPDGQVVATATTDEKVRFWKTSDGSRTGSPTDIPGARTLHFLPGGQNIATSRFSGTLHKYQVSDGADLGELGPAISSYQSSISRDFKTLFICYSDHKLRLLDAESGNVLLTSDPIGVFGQTQAISW